MIRKVIFVCVGLFAFAYGQMDVDLGGLGDIIKKGARFNLTADVQGLLPQMNEFVEQMDMAEVDLPDVKCRKKNGPVLSGVSFQGLNNMVSALRAEATILGPDSLKVCTTIVFENVKLAAEKSSIADSDLSWDIGSMTLDLNFSMLPKKNGEDQCYTTYNRLKIVNLSDIVQHSGNSEFDGKTPETEVVDKVIRYYNKFLKNPRVLRKLSSVLDLCKPSSSTITEAVNNGIETSTQ